MAHATSTPPLQQPTLSCRFSSSLNYPDLSKLQNALTAALKSLDDATAAQGYFKANPGSVAVKNAIDKIQGSR